ncbi:MAG: glutamate racemase [Bacteroidales bacterium]|nr:glutamate racemase [Bacteroidales bacterium]
MHEFSPIGVFDSGYGGLTVLKAIRQKLPQYDYIYLGDNARTPYGTRSYETVLEYTLEAVKWLFNQNCHLIILACNTASSKALRTIQQEYLPRFDPSRRVLGVIRPTVEVINQFTKTKKVGVLGTIGTIKSNSYVIEINKLYPDIKVYQHACPMWVPLVEYNEFNNIGGEYFIQKDLNALLEKDKDIDSIILGCTHYPLLLHIIKKFIPPEIKIITQNEIVANSLAEYLIRHPEIEKKCTKNGTLKFYTTDDPNDFDEKSLIFFGQKINSEKILYKNKFFYKKTI